MINDLKNQDLLGIDIVAKILDVHKETLRRWDRTGILKALRIGDRRGVGDRRYRKIDIIDYLAAKNSNRVSQSNKGKEYTFIRK